MPSHRYIHKFTSGHQSFDCAASDSVASSTNEWQFVVTAAATQWSDIWLLLVRFVSGMNITNGRMKSAKGKKKKKFWFLVGVCPLRHHYTTKRTSRSPHEKHEEYTIHKTHSAFVLSIIIAGNEREISCIFVFLSLSFSLSVYLYLSLFFFLWYFLLLFIIPCSTDCRFTFPFISFQILIAATRSGMFGSTAACEGKQILFHFLFHLSRTSSDQCKL